MTKTLTQLITGVQQDLSQMAGKGVQFYGETRVANYIQQSFELVFKEYYIPEYATWATATLDGATGVVTSDLPFTRFDDIAVIYKHNTEYKIKRAPTNRNLLRLTGTAALYAAPRLITTTAQLARPFVCWPLTATDQLDIYGRVHPANEFAPNDVIFCDDLVLRYSACWMYAEDDGTNPGQITKFKGLFEKRLAQLQSANMQLPTPLDARVEPGLTEWVG